ncbi:MAG: T9SS type A sorting domain-containing protein [Bacteroidales bacterium]|nr:T9SS type A sorting domain-containing protein [Bacteroidales bacterium]
MNKYILILFSAIAFPFYNVYGTHNRCGQITYKHITGLTYEVTVKTYTHSPSPADRPELIIKWGDNFQDTIQRIQITYINYNTNENIYMGTHTYNSPTVYMISVEDPNRNAGIVNIPNSLNTTFYIESMINVFDPDYNCVVNSVDFFLTPPIIKRQNDSKFKFNLTAYDPDNDSISYELVSCKGEGGLYIPGYYMPPNVSINPYNGEFRWEDSTSAQGEYCFAAKINKWRNGRNVSYVLKDFMITVVSLPTILCSYTGIDSLLTDAYGNYYITINPNDTLNLKITFTDANSLHQTAIHSFGEIYLLNYPAIYFSDSSMNISNGYLQWIPKTENGRKRPYLLTFRGYSLDYQTVNDISLFIYVIGNNDTVCPAIPINYSINDRNKFSNSINVFPNPAKNSITIENKGNDHQFYVISIKSILGNEMLIENIDFNTTNTSIDISKINNGIYFLTLRNDKKQIVKKILIQR